VDLEAALRTEAFAPAAGCAYSKRKSVAMTNLTFHFVIVLPSNIIVLSTLYKNPSASSSGSTYGSQACLSGIEWKRPLCA
jgi:hypothetical protein